MNRVQMSIGTDTVAKTHDRVSRYSVIRYRPGAKHLPEVETGRNWRNEL